MNKKKVPTLRSLATRKLSLEEREKRTAEILSGSDRTVAILLAIKVENALRQRLCADLPNADENEEILCGRDGPLSSFHGNIELGYAMAVYDEHLYNDLKIIRHVRNAFAHFENAQSFDIPEIAAECQKLCSAEMPRHEIHSVVHGRGLLDLSLPGDRFIMTCFGAAAMLMKETVSVIESNTAALERVLEDIKAGKILIPRYSD